MAVFNTKCLTLYFATMCHGDIIPTIAQLDMSTITYWLMKQNKRSPVQMISLHIYLCFET